MLGITADSVACCLQHGRPLEMCGAHLTVLAQVRPSTALVKVHIDQVCKMRKCHGMCRYPASSEALKQMDILCSQLITAVRPPQPLSGANAMRS